MDVSTFDATHVLVNGPLPFKPVAVHLDEGPDFQCFATEDRWNGFVKPYFLPAVAHAVAAFVGLRFDAETKGYVDPSDEDSEANPFTPETIKVDGVDLTVYGIGAGSWVWSLSQDIKEPEVKPEVGFQISATIKPDADNSDCEFIAQMLATTPAQREFIKQCVNQRKSQPNGVQLDSPANREVLTQIEALAVTEDVNTGKLRIGFCHAASGIAIHDPQISSCGRFEVDPTQAYQLSGEQVAALAALNEAIETATENALNAGALALQEFLAIEDGGFAGMHFSGDEDRHVIRRIFADYAVAEINFRRPD